MIQMDMLIKCLVGSRCKMFTVPAKHILAQPTIIAWLPLYRDVTRHIEVSSIHSYFNTRFNNPERGFEPGT